MSSEVDEFLNSGTPAAETTTTETTVDEFLGSSSTPTPPAPASAPASTQQDPIAGVGSSALTGVNRAIAKTLGAPSDMLNNIVGSELFGDTSQQFEELFTRMGLIQPVTSPFAERVGQTVGEGAAALVPVMGAGQKLLQGAKGVAGMVGEGLTAIRDFAARAPGTFIASELGTSLAAGTGGATAEVLFPNNPAAEIMGELTGAVAPGMLAYTPTRLALKAIRSTIIPFTKAGARDRAAARIGQIVGDPDAALANMDTNRGLGLTPAQASKDPGLLALEKSVIQSNRQLGIEYEQQAAISNRLLQQTLEDVADDGSIALTREFLDQRRQYLIGLMETRINNASAIAQRRIEHAQPRMNRQQANLMLREELDKAYDAARKQEDEIWGTVPRNIAVNNGTTRERFESILAQRGVADDPDDIPGFVRQLVGDIDEDGVFQAGQLGDNASVGDMLTFRSRLLRAQREERAKPAPNRRKLDILGDMQEAVLHDLGAAGTPESEVGRSIRAALDFSADLNQRFTRGPVGSLLGFERRGGPSTLEDLTAEKLFGLGGPKAGANADALLAAADTPETRGAVEEFVKNLFVAQTVDRAGRVTPAAAERFMQKHTGLLNRFPELRNTLRDAGTAQRLADETSARMGDRMASLRDKRYSRAALFLEAPPDREIDAVMRSGNPRGAMTELVKMVRKDPTGEALKGLKSAYVDNLIKRTTQSNFDADGNPFFSGRRMLRLLHDESPVIEPLFNESEKLAVRRIATAAASLENSLKAAPLDTIINDNPSMLVGLLSRIVGARAGAAMGSHTTGASLATAGAGSRFVRAVVSKLSVDRAQQMLVDATQDPVLMRALLTDASTPRRQQFVQRSLDAWLLTTGERAFEDDGTSAEQSAPSNPP